MVAGVSSDGPLVITTNSDVDDRSAIEKQVDELAKKVLEKIEKEIKRLEPYVIKTDSTRRRTRYYNTLIVLKTLFNSLDDKKNFLDTIEKAQTEMEKLKTCGGRKTFNWLKPNVDAMKKLEPSLVRELDTKNTNNDSVSEQDDDDKKLGDGALKDQDSISPVITDSKGKNETPEELAFKEPLEKLKSGSAENTSIGVVVGVQSPSDKKSSLSFSEWLFSGQ
ncbi:MAG: hypothetical protein AAF443_04535 [Chlamydiota bacterium]